MLRMMWFMNFLLIMFQEILEDKKQSPSQACSKAYERALAPNHMWIVKVGARAAMMAAPDRKKFLYLVVEKDKTAEFAYETID